MDGPREGIGLLEKGFEALDFFRIEFVLCVNRQPFFVLAYATVDSPNCASTRGSKMQGNRGSTTTHPGGTPVVNHGFPDACSHVGRKFRSRLVLHISMP